MSPQTFAMSTVTRYFTQTFSYFIPGQPFLETFMPLSYSSGTNIEMCSFEMKCPSVCCWNRRDRERMFSPLSTGLTLLLARRKRKEMASMVSAAFYVARGSVPGQNSIGHSHRMK